MLRPRSSFPVRAALALASLAAVANACSSQRPPVQVAASPSLPNPATLLPGGTSSPKPPGAGQSPRAGSGSSPGSGVETPGPSPSPIDIGYPDEVPVEATIKPACVVRGGTATITVQTEPKISVAYHAVYAGTKGGAVPPYGYGYGGNDKGFSDDEGRWSATWVVRADAPIGPARADVVVASGEGFGYDDPPFYVAGSAAGCPG